MTYRERIAAAASACAGVAAWRAAVARARRHRPVAAARALVACAGGAESPGTAPPPVAVDSAAHAAPCDGAPDPERPTGIVALFERLEAQRCLHEEDIAQLEGLLEEEQARSTLWCDAVWRVSSTDGLRFDGPPERVIDHASVPDVIVTDDGRHVVVYNDVTPGRLPELLRTDPERLWRQGLLGYGGVGMYVGDASGLAEEDGLDLALDRLHEAVDPDLGRKPDGSWHLAWFGVLVEDMREDGGPLWSAMPHKFFRSASTDLLRFEPAAVAVASSEGSTRGVDPTVLDLADGGEILFVSPLDTYAMGWSSPDGTSWDADAPPDVPTEVPAATPDAFPHPEGGYAMVFMRNGDRGNFQLSRSADGRSWEEPTTLLRVDGGFNPSLARAPDGTWWLYYNVTDADCVEELAAARPGLRPPG